MGISVEEYDRRWNEILRRFGGSIATPNGWAAEGNYHSCNRPAIFVPHGTSIDADQRQDIIERAEAKYGTASR